MFKEWSSTLIYQYKFLPMFINYVYQQQKHVTMMRINGLVECVKGSLETSG